MVFVRRFRFGSRYLWIGLAALALSSAFLTGCNAERTAAAAPTKGGRGDVATPVLVAKATQRDVPIQAEVIGAVEASSAVSLRPQISGQILEARFKEGDFVKAGQLLITIDPRAIEAQLNQLEAENLKDKAALLQAQAALTRDRAQQANAKGQLDRAALLWKEGVISKEQYDQYVATDASWAATINADLAAIENAKAQIVASRATIDNQKVQLSFTKILAPISGRTGTLTVKPGNIVTANTTELATINQLQPVYVSFSLPEAHLAALRGNSGKKLPVSVIPEEGGQPHIGTLAFYENSVDTSSGTIRLKATLENTDHALWPGQFVRVTLKLGEHNDAILVPSQAVQSGQEGTFVYIVQPDSKVEFRNVTVAQRMGDESVIEKGLAPGETVVTEGTLRLIPGSRVPVRERGDTPGGGRPGAAVKVAAKGRLSKAARKTPLPNQQSRKRVAKPASSESGGLP